MSPGPPQTLAATAPGALARAADRLAEGGLLAFPTETVYGLGARADDPRAVEAIFVAKGRPHDHPLIVHVADATAAAAFAADIPPAAERLMQAFWPGPLTLILPRREGVAAAAAAGQPTIGLRAPRHPVAQALLAAVAERGVQGVAAPSANRFGRLSPTRAAHVAEEFAGNGLALMVLDGGPCELGIESTIVDCTRGTPVVLRPGSLGLAALADAAGTTVRAADPNRDAQAPRASGTLASHYAPRARLRLMTAAQLRAAFELAGDELARANPGRIAVWARSVTVPAGWSHRRMPTDAQAAAFELFAVLRDFDAAGVELIWVEQPPTDDPTWDGVHDRLRRAAT